MFALAALLGLFPWLGACCGARAKACCAGPIRLLVAALKSDTDPSFMFAIDALDVLTGRSFGEAQMPFLHSIDEHAQAAHDANAALARRWLAWWEDEGKAQYPQR